MAALMLLAGPLISRHTMPISSVTLAWRTLVITGNLWPSSHTTGLVIILGGYISHSRFCTDSAAVLDLAIGMGILSYPPAMAGMMLTSSPSRRAVSWFCRKR